MPLSQISAQNPLALSFAPASFTGSAGQTINVDVLVTDWTDVLSGQVFLEWDETLLRFDSVSDILGSATNPSPSEPDSIRVGEISILTPAQLSPGLMQMIFLHNSLTDITVETIPANSKLFTLHFTLLGAVGNTTIDLSCSSNTCEVDHEDEFGSWSITPFTLTNNGGVVTEPIDMSAGSAAGPTGSTRCVPVTVDGFTDIVNFSSTLNYDENVLTYKSIQNINSGVAGLDMSDFTTSTAGEVALTWTNPAGQNLTNGQVLYEVCFDLDGIGGSSSAISFTGNSAMSSSESITVNPTSGNVSIQSAADFKFLIDDIQACPGERACVPVRVEGFQNIIAMQIQIGFDITKLQNPSFVSKIPAEEGFGLTGTINNATVGVDSIRILGSSDFIFPDAAKVGSDLVDNGILFEICFDVVDSKTDIVINETSAGGFRVGKYNDSGQNVDIPVSVFNGSLGSVAPTLELSTTTDIVCGGETTGAIDLTVSNGVPDFTYSWIPAATSEDLTGIGPGNYAVTVTDDCDNTVSANYTISETNTPITITGTTTNASNLTAADGKIDITVNGGNGTYTFSWDNSSILEDPMDFQAGDHTVTVTDTNGCTKTATFTVVSDQIDLALNDDNTTILDVACFGGNTGAINLGVEGGTGSYTATWSPVLPNTINVSGLTAGEYCVTVSDGSTSVSNCYTVNQPTAPLTVNPIVTQQTVCGGANDGAINLTISGGSPSYVFLWSNTQTSEDISGLNNGSYTVTVSDAKGCSSVNFYTVSCGDPLVINGSETVVTDETCGGANDGTITLVVSGGTTPYSYSWPNTNQNQGSLSPGDYTVTVTDANNLTATQTFTVSAATEMVITGIPNPVTANSLGTIEPTVTFGSKPYNYSWSSPTYADFSKSTKNISELNEGTYILLVSDSNGCTKEQTFVVGITFGIGGVDITHIGCFGESTGSIHLSINGGEPPYTTSWTKSGDADFSKGTRDITELSAGTYTVVVTDNLGASVEDTYEVTQPISGLDIAITNKQDVIGGTLGSINITVTGGTAPYSYLWSNGATSQDITELMKDCYSVTVTDANDCVMETGDICIEAPFVSGDVTKIEPKCNGDCDGSISFLLYGGQPPYNVKWSVPGHDKTIGLNGPNTIFANELCSGTYAVTVTDNTNDTYTKEFTLSEPTVIVVGSNVDEVNAIIDITPTGGIPPYTYLWSRNGEKNEDLLNIASGSYCVTVTDDNGCRKVECLTVELPPITVTSSIVKPECPDDKTGSIELTVSGGIQPYTYEWDPTGAKSQNLFNIPAGTYSVTITDNNGATKAYVVDLKAESDLDASLQITRGISAESACDGSAFVGVTGGEAPYTYVWRNNNVVLASLTETITGLCEGVISVEVTDKLGCAMTIEVDLVAPIILTVVITERKPISCDDECDGILQGIPNGGTAPYTYKWSNNTIGQTANGLCSDTYSVTVTDANGIQVTVEKPLFSPDQLDITFNVSPPTMTNGNDGTAEAIVEGGTLPYNYEWNGGDCNSADCIFASGEYWVLVTDARGCEITESVVVPTETIPCFSSSAIMTLDGTHDGRNDFFRVRCIEGTNNRLTIFNRWGQLVYETENYQNDWNGVDIKGNPVPEGAYYYILEVNGAGSGDQYKGHITILK